jgi:hypothetical protein
LRAVFSEFLLSQDCLRRSLLPAVIARLDRATQYSRDA